MDPFEVLEEAVNRAIRNGQYRTSVNPHAVRELFGKVKMLERALEVKERVIPIAHKHRQDGGVVFEHSHPRGNIPHGHHGSRFVEPDTRPRIEI